MSKKYKKEKPVMIDLKDRGRIKIIPAEKEENSDDKTELFQSQLQSLFEMTDEFSKYCIKKQSEAQPKISDEDFEITMKEIMRQHKILKNLLKEQDY